MPNGLSQPAPRVGSSGADIEIEHSRACCVKVGSVDGVTLLRAVSRRGRRWTVIVCRVSSWPLLRSDDGSGVTRAGERCSVAPAGVGQAVAGAPIRL